MQREADVQRSILRVWGGHPKVRLWRANAGRALVPTASGALRPIQVNLPGCPDLVGWVATVRGALFLGIEVKAQGGRIREAQAAFLATLARMGGIGIVARSVSDVDAVLGPLVGEV